MTGASTAVHHRDLVATDLIIIPTHNRPDTVGLAVRSVQNQSVDNLDIAIIGDGVTDETRDALRPQMGEDPRITFIDRPKGARHGEEYRDETIRRSSAQRIHYLGDDDLFFPNHVETMNNLVEGVDFANSLPIFLHVDGTLTYLPTDLSIPACIAWHLDPVERRNSVSLTGVTHTRDSYNRLPFGWRPAPIGRWTDHYMWEQYFSLDGVTARTSHRATTAKFNNLERAHHSGPERAAEISKVLSHMSRAAYVDEWNERVSRRVREHSAQSEILIQQSLTRIFELEAERDQLTDQLGRSTRALKTMEQTISWRITRPLRTLRARQLGRKSFALNSDSE